VREIREFATRQLADFKVPRRLLVFDEIPKGPTGKLQRIGLAARLDLIASRHQAEQRRPGTVAPRSPLETRLAEIWAQLLKLENVGVDANFFEIGGDSLLATELFFLVSETLQVQLSLAQFFEAPTIAEQARAISESRRGLLPPSVVPIQSSGTKPPLFCVTAGTEVGYLANLGMLLAPDQPLYALRPSRVAEHPERYVPEQAAANYVEEIRALQPEGPYLVAGWCAGAAVALEVGRLLLDLDQDVALLAVFTPVLYSRFNHSIRAYVKSVWSLPVREKLGRLLGTLRSVVGDLRTGIRRLAPRAQGRVEISQAIQEINRQALRPHAQPVYPGRVTLFLTEDVGRDVPASKRPEAVFGTLAAGGLDVYKVSGDHNSVVRHPHVEELASTIRHCVDRVTAR
jgi:oxalate---CoA ligase